MSFSTEGCGTHMGDSKTSGNWLRTDHKLYTNCLELKSIFLAIQHWAPVLRGRQVMIAKDDARVVHGDKVQLPALTSSGPIPVFTLTAHSSLGCLIKDLLSLAIS